MVRVILVRHGETTWNITGRYQGQEDTPLSPLGQQQGRLLAQALKAIPIDYCLASPLQRAYQTCLYCAELHQLTPIKDKRLLEINHGTWEGVLAEDIQKEYPQEFELWHSQPQLVQMPQGENLEEVRQRVRAAFDEYAVKYADKTILVAAHDAVNKAIICDVLGLGMDHFWQIKQDNTCINVLEYQNNTWRLVLLNSTNHLGFLFSGIEQAGL